MRIEEYQDLRGRSPFKEWFDDLDTQTALVVNTVITRMRNGNTSNIESVGGGVFERVIDRGPGYRLYFGREGKDMIILLLGGSKRGQQNDIDKAKLLWVDYKDRQKF